MKRILMTTLAALLATSAADAGNLRDRLAARFARPCQPCQQPQQVQYQPATQTVQPTYQPQPVQQVAYYQPAGFAPVVRPATCSGGVCR